MVIGFYVIKCMVTALRVFSVSEKLFKEMEKTHVHMVLGFLFAELLP